MVFPFRASIIIMAFLSAAAVSAADEARDVLFASPESKAEFAAEISDIIEKAWKKWQDAVIIDDVDVEGSYGLMLPGDMKEPVLTAKSIMYFLKRRDRGQEYITSVKAVAQAVENGMRRWQRGYTHRNIPFPQGASCSYTLPPCNNVPVTLASGSSSGDGSMSEEALYSYMLYRIPNYGKDAVVIMRAAAGAIAECFEKWKNSCSIVGILATGGIAPQPAPMGTGPGPVRGAKGNNGKLVGPYIDGALMREKMVEYFRQQGE